jgi:hypothetical protein
MICKHNSHKVGSTILTTRSSYNLKYLHDVSCAVIDNRAGLALFGMTLVAVAVSLLLMPVTTMVSAQTVSDGGVGAIMTSGTNETAATATPTGSGNYMTGEAKFLFIQGALSGSISEINATTSTLELNDVSDKTILFSDRPDRIVASANTSDFIGHWSMGPDSFAVDPPNAVLVVDDEEQSQELAIIELYNPEYDPVANTLKYDITVENVTATTTTPINLPGEFGQSTLVIDDDSGHYCLSLHFQGPTN